MKSVFFTHSSISFQVGLYLLSVSLFFFFSTNLFYLSDLFLSPLLILSPHFSNFPIYPHLFIFFCDFCLPFFSVLLFFLCTLKGRTIWKLFFFFFFFFLKLLSEKATLSGPAFLSTATTPDVMGLRTRCPRPQDQSIVGLKRQPAAHTSAFMQKCSFTPDIQSCLCLS